MNPEFNLLAPGHVANLFNPADGPAPQASSTILQPFTDVTSAALTHINRDNSADPEPPAILSPQTTGAGLPVQGNQGAPPASVTPQIGDIQIIGFDGTHYFPLVLYTDGPAGAGNFMTLTSAQSQNFVQTLMDKSFDWFMIYMNACLHYKQYLCTTNCAPGSATITRVTAAINKGISSLRRLNGSEGWTPQNVTIIVKNKSCRTILSGPFLQALRAEVAITRDELLQTAYETTRGLLVPGILSGLNDNVTTENWTTPAGGLEWNDRWGHRMFHVDSGVIEHDGFDAITWFGRPGIREFLYRFFRASGNPEPGACVEMYQCVQDDHGHNYWEEVEYATDSMVAFGLGWMAAVVDTDVLQNHNYTEGLVTKRRCEHFVSFYRRIVGWLKSLRDGSHIEGLSVESRAEAVHGLNLLCDLSPPNPNQ